MRVFSSKYLLFFSVLFLLIFLGESKQPAVDVVGAASVVGVALYAKYYLKKRRALPIYDGIAWGVLLLYLIIRSLCSDDIGFSLFATIRYIDAFLIYHTCYCYFEEKGVQSFLSSLFWFCLAAMGAAAVVTSLPALQGHIPRMNVLYPAYGHNHLVDILLFGFPAAFFLALFTRKKRYIFFSIAFTIGILFSMARAAMIVVGIYICCMAAFLYIKKIPHPRMMLFGILGVIILGCGLIFITVENNVLPHSAVAPKKTSVFLDTRRGYYQQALQAIQESPLFGFGPGTFYLQSLRLQNKPQSYSWFAHNFYLEQLVELGGIGVALLAGIGICITLHIVKSVRNARRSIYRGALLVGLIVSLGYGGIDISLNYLVVWLLCWSCIGISAVGREQHRTSPYKAFRYIYVTAIIICMSFYGVMVASYVFPKSSVIGFIDVYNAIDRIKNEDDERVIQKAVLLHKDNPEVLFAARRYRDAFVNDPQNTAYFRAYYSSLVQKKDYDGILALFDVLRNTYMTDTSMAREIYRRLQDQKEKVFTEESVDFLRTPPDIRNGLSKMFYFFGLKFLQDDPATTKLFWEAAREVSPQLGHFYAELAGLYYTEGAEREARQVLLECQAYQYPKKQCELVPWPPPAPGSLRQNIWEYPTIH
jgi:O-antigen ligase